MVLFMPVIGYSACVVGPLRADCSFPPDQGPELADCAPFLLIFFWLFWYKLSKICLYLSRIAIFTARLSLIFACQALRMV